MSGDGGPAFPRAGYDGPDNSDSGEDGMSLRDWLAGMAMQGMAPHVVFPQSVEDQLHKSGVETDDFEAWTAHVAYGFADAMLAERERKDPTDA